MKPRVRMNCNCSLPSIFLLSPTFHSPQAILRSIIILYPIFYPFYLTPLVFNNPLAALSFFLHRSCSQPFLCSPFFNLFLKRSLSISIQNTLLNYLSIDPDSVISHQTLQKIKTHVRSNSLFTHDNNFESANDAAISLQSLNPTQEELCLLKSSGRSSVFFMKSWEKKKSTLEILQLMNGILCLFVPVIFTSSGHLDP